MLISAVRAYNQDQPFVAGPYTCRGQTEDRFQSIIVSVKAENGQTGWGEAAPLGAFYAEAFPEQMEQGVVRLLPMLIGQRADYPVALARLMDRAMLGQPAVKSAIDMAAWELSARLAGRPLALLLGGGGTREVPLYRSISQADPDEMARTAQAYEAQGYRRLQVKVGEDPVEQHKLDLELEIDAVKRLNKGIQLCQDKHDNGTRELLQGILVNEEEGIDWLEAQLHAIGEIGKERYLAQQLHADGD